MKTFVPLALFAAVAFASEVTLEDVYGPAPKVEKMAPIAGGTRSRAAKPQAFYDRRSAELCDFPFEILLVQDVTASFDDNFDAMVNTQLPQMFSVLGASHPDTTYGVVTFRDKPIAPLGTPATDSCQEIGVDFTSNVTEVTSFYAPLRRVGGGDPAENQFGALIASVQSNQISWGANAESTKLIVMVTDAPPHFEGDGHNTFGMLPATGTFSDATAVEDCLAYYYPSPDQVLSGLQSLEAYMAVLVYDPEYWNGLPAKSWQWFNRFIGQTDDFANLAANDQSDFWVKLSQIIQFIENLECVDGTTTPPPVTVTLAGSTQGTPPPLTTAIVGPPLTALPSETTTVDVGSTAIVGPPLTALPSDTTTTTSTTTPPVVTPPPATDECAETIICEDDVLIKIGFPPDNLNVVVNGKQIA